MEKSPGLVTENSAMWYCTGDRPAPRAVRHQSYVASKWQKSDYSSGRSSDLGISAATCQKFVNPHPSASVYTLRSVAITIVSSTVHLQHRDLVISTCRSTLLCDVRRAERARARVSLSRPVATADMRNQPLQQKGGMRGS